MRGNERLRKLMRRGSGSDTVGTESKVSWRSSYIRKEERGQRQQLRLEKRRTGEVRGATWGGAAPGEKIVSV